MNLILFGFKKCGKTTYGKKLAKQLQLTFIDTDQIIETLYEADFGQRLPCRAIYEKIGGRAFRLLEREAIFSLQEVHHAVISVGGGAMIDPLIAATLEKLGTLIYLKFNKESIKKRILSGELPAYLDPHDPEGSFEDMYEIRKERFDKIPAKIVDMEGKSEKEVLTILKNFYPNLKEDKHGE